MIIRAKARKKVPPMSSALQDSFNHVRAQILGCTKLYQRESNDVALIAVSKTVSAKRVESLAKLGQIHFGENYAQEGVSKKNELAELTNQLGLIWHFIGPIQSNKTKIIAENFDWVHSVDRLKIAQRLGEQRGAHKSPLQVCIQVNLDDESSKSGVIPSKAIELALQIRNLPGINLRGLMAIPHPVDGLQAQIKSLKRAQELFAQVREELRKHDFDTLSMGMSADLEAAIACGATMVRIGTAIFGPRTTQTSTAKMLEQ